MSPVYFLTPTGGRPQALKLLFQYLEAQEYRGAATWILVDDCEPGAKLAPTRFKLQHVRPPWRWTPGSNTQARSLAYGLKSVPDEAVLLVLEDDDVYLPEHVSNVLVALNQVSLVGELISRYYNMKTGRFQELKGSRHCSLASTAMRGEALKIFRSTVETSQTLLDVKLWSAFRGPKMFLNTANVIGVKGMPGRAGIGVGHRPGFGSLDHAGRFQSLVGSEIAQEYARFAQ